MPRILLAAALLALVVTSGTVRADDAREVAFEDDLLAFEGELGKVDGKRAVAGDVWKRMVDADARLRALEAPRGLVLPPLDIGAPTDGARRMTEEAALLKLRLRLVRLSLRRRPPRDEGEAPPVGGAVLEQLEQLEALVEGLIRRIEALEARFGGGPGVGTRPPDDAPETPSVQPTVRKDYDRFTGRWVLEVESGPVPATHKDDAGERIEVLLRWLVHGRDSAATSYVLQIGSDSIAPRWRSGASIYILTDGRRDEAQIGGRRAATGNAEAFAYVGVSFDGAGAERLEGADLVEIRAGDWEFVVPTAFLRSVSEANRRARQAPDEGAPR